MSVFQQATKERIWQETKDLTIISAFFSWVFHLLSRLAEPLMTLSALYIIVESGVSSVSTPWLHNTSLAIMISAPEIILPGSFVMASQASAQGKKKARLLYSMCWLFVTLTILTLASLFVFHWIGWVFDLLMCARCAAGVGYSILIRVMSHERREEVHVQSHKEMQVLLDRFMVEQERYRVELVQSLTMSFTEQVQAQVQEMQTRMNRELVHQSQKLSIDTESCMTVSTPEPNPVRGEPSESSQSTAKEIIYTYLQQQHALHIVPSIGDILEACGCSKNTVIKWKRKFYQEVESQKSAVSA